MKEKIKKLNLNNSLCERGWFLGHFAKIPELNNEEVEAQITELKAGENKGKTTFNKKGKTLTMLLNDDGEMNISFPDEKKEFVLSKKWDFLIFDEKIYHTWKCKRKADILTIRWPSLPNDVIEKTG
jgi:hypothetical protein